MAKDSYLPGFDLPTQNDDEGGFKFKTQKVKIKNGQFQSMGLSFPVLKGITKRGYRIPTPVQRKTIPLILEGRDVVAMAKTGSGKTACFLIPMFEKLRNRQPTMNARALVLAPTRELAIQTFKFIKELGKFMDLKTILVLGGDPINAQFSAIHSCPDIIVATPGRFLHLCVEMELKLNSVEYVVFDEADRLFEMGFGEQLNETLSRLPESRQMVMFSATLPKVLVDFAKAGLNDPVLIRLDVDSKLPEKLKLKFVHVRPEERYSALICILKYLIDKQSQTVVFVGTQHHVELVSYILDKADISNTQIYSSMDPAARKINTARFTLNQVSVLIVTDVAARGIDIPSLDYVINVHFPGKPKLFVHRVGRCARAGRHGTAFSLVSTEDEAHLLDLYLFLNRSFDISNQGEIGSIPADVLEDEHAAVTSWIADQHVSGVLRTSINAFKKYMHLRPDASTDSNKRVKSINFASLPPLRDFEEYLYGEEVDEKKDVLHSDLLLKMRNYRPSGTIFELNPHQKASQQFMVMKEKRKEHGEKIKKFKEQKQEQEMMDVQIQKKNDDEVPLSRSTESDITSAFKKVVAGKKTDNMDSLYKKKKKKKNNKKRSAKGGEMEMSEKKKKRIGATLRDEENYIPYQSSDKHTEDGLAINSFEQQARRAEISIVQETREQQYKPGQKKWDRIKKKMVTVENPKAGKIRTESGIWIPATYKTGRYTEWKEKNKIEEKLSQEMGDDFVPIEKEKYPTTRYGRHNAKLDAKKHVYTKDNEKKTPEQIVRERMRLELIKTREKSNRMKKDHSRKRNAKNIRKKKRT